MGLFILGVYMTSLSVLCIYDNVKHSDFVMENPYFRSSGFQRELQSYCQNINNLYIYYKSYDVNFGESKVTKEDIYGLKQFYQNKLTEEQIQIQNDYNNQINEAERNSNKDRVNKLTDEKNKRLEEIRKENNKSDEELKKEVALRFDKDYESIKKSVQGRTDIKYYIKDKTNKLIYTNLENGVDVEGYIKNRALYSISFPLKYSNSDEFMGINNIFKNFNWEGCFIIPQGLDSSSYIFNSYQYYDSSRRRVIKEGIIGIASLIVGLFILICIKKDENLSIPIVEKIKDLYIKMPMDLIVFIFIIYTYIMLEYLMNLNFFYKPLRIEHFVKLTIVGIYLVYLVFNIKNFIKITKNKEELLNKWKKSLIYKLCETTKGSIVGRNIKLQVLAITIFTIVLALFTLIVIVFMAHNIFLGVIISVSYIFLVLRYIFKKVNYLNEVLKGTEEIASGNLEYVIKERDQEPLSKIACNINNMRTGYKKSLESQIKSERLKTELITNVSHDLKTPLTSIINYISLLKKEDLSEEEVKGYIGVLERKAERLKVLIEDLFEASKMSSGSVELNIEKVDVAALLKQSIAELDEKIRKSSLIFKFRCDNKNVYVNLDGKKTWRVFENLINNIIKYSQPSTRVYIDLIEDENKVLIVMKNISSYEMDFDVEEIFERFKRGDKSRNTEGSGLGLAIANSIVQLQGGKLDIEIDGDLFKAIVQFNKF